MPKFDPTKFGAKEVTQAPAFDPAKFGAKEVQPTPAAPAPTNNSGGGPLSFVTDPNHPLNRAADAISNALVVQPVKSIVNAALGPGRNIVSLMTAGTEHPVASAASDLAHVTTMLIQKARVLPEGDPRKSQLMQIVQDNMKTMGMANEEMDTLQGTQRTAEQAAGEGASALGNSLVLLNPASIAGKMLASTGIGALTAGGSAMEHNASTGEVAKSVGVGGVLGAGVQGAASGIGAISKWVTGNLPTRMMRAVTGQSAKEIRAGKDLSRYMLDNAKVGTRESLITDSSSNVEQLGSQIASHLRAASKQGGTVSNMQIAKMVAQKFNDVGADITPNDVLGMVSRSAPQVKGFLSKGVLPVDQANEFRQGLDLTLGDKGFLASQVPFSKAVLREYANTLRTGVKAQAPVEVRGMYDELAKEINLRDALLDQSAKTERGSVVKFGDLIAGLIGSPLGLPGIVGAAAVERGVRSAPFLTGSSVALDRIGSTLPYLSKLSPAMRLFVANVAPSLGGGSKTQSSQ